jgi:hypothetical protein
MNETANFIEEMLTEHFDYIERDFAILDEDEFDQCFHDYPQARYGWTFPEIGMFCVEKISRQIEHLHDYLRAILWMIDIHVVRAFENPDESALERHRAIESRLYDIAPQSMVLVSAVELRALDDMSG